MSPDRGAALPLIASAGLAGLWFVPDLWLDGVTFSFESLERLDAATRVAKVTPPICGALALAATALRTRGQAGARGSLGDRAVGLLGAAALAVLPLSNAPAVHGPPLLATVAGLAAGVTAGRLLSRTRAAAAGMLAAAPAAVLLAAHAVAVFFEGSPPAGYLAGWKGPFTVLFATLLVAAGSRSSRGTSASGAG